MSFSIAQETSGHFVISLDMVFSPSEPQFALVEDFVNRIPALHIKRVTLDFSNCKYIDTKAISLIVSMYSETREMGAEIQVVGADEEIKDLMHSIQLDEIVLIK